MPGSRVTSLSAGTVGLLALGVLGVSVSGPLMAAATAVPALAMSMWRTGLAAGLVAPVALTRSRDDLRRQSPRQLQLSLLAGLMLAAHFAAWTTSLRLTSVASATALVCLQVAWVVVITRLAGGHVAPAVWWGLGLALAGVLIISGVDFSLSTRAVTGDLLALLGGVFSAAYTVLGGRVREAVSTPAYTLVCYTTSAAVLLVACLVWDQQLAGYGVRSWLLILGVTLGSQLLGHSVFNYLLKRISPTVVSMVVLLEVPGAALLAAVFLKQAPPLAVYAGLAAILAGLLLVLATRSAQGPVGPPVVAAAD